MPLGSPDEFPHRRICRPVRGVPSRSSVRRPIVRSVLRRVRFAAFFDLTVGAYLTGVGFTLLQLSQGKPFEGKDLFAAHWSVLFVGLYYVFLLYAPVLVLAALAARGRSFGVALLIRLVAFAVPAGVLMLEAAIDLGPGGAFRVMGDVVGIPLAAGLLSTAASEVAHYVWLADDPTQGHVRTRSPVRHVAAPSSSRNRGTIRPGAGPYRGGTHERHGST